MYRVKLYNYKQKVRKFLYHMQNKNITRDSHDVWKLDIFLGRWFADCTKQHYLTKCVIETNYWTKNANFGRRYLIHWYQLMHSHIVGIMPFRFYWVTLYSK